MKQSILVTGASDGIGSETARQAALAGNAVLMVDLAFMSLLFKGRRAAA